MKLKTVKREGKHKSELTKIRKEGNIAGIFYGRDQKNSLISIDGAQFQKILRSIEPGFLSTTVLELDFEGKIHSVLVKDIQYHRTSYRIEHIDFILLNDEHPVNLSVPIQCTGLEVCVGVLAGGALRQVLRSVRVRCLPKNIPNSFQIDVSDLNMAESKRLSSITMPEGVRALTPLTEVAVVVAKR